MTRNPNIFYSHMSLIKAILISTLNISFIIETRKDIPRLSTFVSWPSAMINRQWLELPMSRTKFHIPKDVRAIEFRLYIYVTLSNNLLLNWMFTPGKFSAICTRKATVVCSCLLSFWSTLKGKALLSREVGELWTLNRDTNKYLLYFFQIHKIRPCYYFVEHLHCIDGIIYRFPIRS